MLSLGNRTSKTTSSFHNSFLNNLNDAVLVIEDGLFVDCNEVAFRMFGASSKTALTNTHPGKVSPAEQPDGQSSKDKAETVIGRALENGFCQFDWLHCKLDGTPFH